MSRRCVTAAVKAQCTVEIGMHLCELLARLYRLELQSEGSIYKGVMHAVRFEYVGYSSSRCSA
jgi:hypothetical protein